MDKLNNIRKGVRLPVLIGLGIPVGLLLWCLLVQWLYDSFFPVFGAPMLGFRPSVALAVMLLLLIGLAAGMKEVGK